jgi:hypothetical protein
LAIPLRIGIPVRVWASWETARAANTMVRRASLGFVIVAGMMVT